MSLRSKVQMLVGASVAVILGMFLPLQSWAQSDCTVLASWGVYNDHDIVTYSTFVRDLIHYYHSNQFSSFDQARAASFGGTIPVGDVLVGLEGQANESTWNAFMSETEEQLVDKAQRSQYLHDHQHSISADLLTTIKECLQRDGIHIRQEWNAQDPDDSTYALLVSYQKGADTPDAGVVDLDLSNADSWCSLGRHHSTSAFRVRVEHGKTETLSCRRFNRHAARIAASDVRSHVVEGSVVYLPKREGRSGEGAANDTTLVIENHEPVSGNIDGYICGGVCHAILGGALSVTPSVTYQVPAWVKPGSIRRAVLVLDAVLDDNGVGSNHDISELHPCDHYQPRVIYQGAEIRAPNGCLWSHAEAPGRGGGAFSAPEIPLSPESVAKFNANLPAAVVLQYTLPGAGHLNNNQFIAVKSSALILVVRKPQPTLPPAQPRGTRPRARPAAAAP